MSDDEEVGDDAGADQGDAGLGPDVGGDSDSGEEHQSDAFEAIPVLRRRKHSLNYDTIDTGLMERIFEVHINDFDHVFDKLSDGKKLGQVRNIQGHLLMASCPCHADRNCKLLLKAEGAVRPKSRASIIKWLVSAWQCTYEEHFAQTVTLRKRFNMPPLRSLKTKWIGIVTLHGIGIGGLLSAIIGASATCTWCCTTGAVVAYGACASIGGSIAGSYIEGARWGVGVGADSVELAARSSLRGTAGAVTNCIFCSEGAKRYCDFDMRVLSWLLVVCTPTNVRTRHIRKHQHKSYLEIITFEFPETNPRNSTPRFSAILWNPRSQPLVSTFKS